MLPRSLPARSRACPRSFAPVVGALLLVLLMALAGQASTQFAIAREAHLSGHHPEAVTALRAHLTQHPRDASAWLWLGASYFQMGHLQDAAEAFERAAALSPSGDASLWLGAAYARLGRETDARAAFTSAGRSRGRHTALIAQQWLRALNGRLAPVLDAGVRPDLFAYVVRWYNSQLTPAQVDAIVRSVLFFSHYYGVDPRLVMALIAVESGFQISARSPAGAYGLGQLMPATAQALGVVPGDPVANIYGTVRWLRSHLDRFGGNYALALAAYNAGRGAVLRYNGIPPYQETQWYVYNVLALYRRLAGG